MYTSKNKMCNFSLSKRFLAYKIEFAHYCKSKYTSNKKRCSPEFDISFSTVLNFFFYGIYKM